MGRVMPTSQAQDAESVERYFKEICEGKREMPESLAMLICSAVKEGFKLQGTMTRVDMSATPFATEHDEKHKKFKQLMEELRDMTDVNKKKEYISKHFSNLTGDELAVLLEEANDCSKKFHANNLNISVDMFHSLKKSAEQKLKS